MAKKTTSAQQRATENYRKRNKAKGLKTVTVLVPYIYARELRAIAYDMRVKYKHEVLNQTNSYTEKIEKAADEIIDALQKGKNVNRKIAKYKELRLMNGATTHEVKPRPIPEDTTLA